MTTHNRSNGAHSEPKRVVITGMGAITPLGLSLAETWRELLAGHSGIDHISRFDTSDLRTTFAGEVRNFDPANYMDRKEARRLDPYIQYALAATKEAVADAGIDFSVEDPSRVGVIVGTGIGGLQSTLENYDIAQTRGLRRVSPFMIPNMLVDSAAGKIAIEYNLHGPNHAVVSACASGTSASGEAFELLRRGDADVMIVGGAEAAIVPIIVAGFDIMGALSQRNDDPAGACRPFDQDRDGFVMSEGSAIMIMETEEHARARGARIYAEVIGYGSSADAYSMAAPHEQGRGAIDAMRMALRKAAEYGVRPEDVDYINAHGTATRLNDVTETMAIKQVLGEHAYNVRISSTKSMLGHLLGGAGAIETVICAKVIQEGIIPPTINLHNPDPECDLNYTPLVAQKADVAVTLSNSFGFGGHNACIMLRRYE
ncbi:beta-ketoacyl-ACP synthase II [Litorilinea aerophila]|uniref:3-oxoacyl-[acyl-carrier-protein] synthase 2 n=1 Tax=Litorilinea aerophila TaxID=1204385 RepID=A0A540VI04_9CHLR|nr:beta-ketoacyl-ACP synthase II [Litorilinea aerophila]MCC9076029.1 beta-ketoacyl-ACP synthase II [Litorilinea aerophila]